MDRATVKRSQPRSLETRATILAAAEQVFAKAGLDGARIDAIADAAGVNKALLYYYFKSKGGLYEAVMEDHFREFNHRALAVLGGRERASDVLLRYVSLYFDFISTRRRYAALYQQLMTTRGRPLERLVRKYFVPRNAAFNKLLERGIRAGEFRRTDAHHTAMSIVSLIVSYDPQIQYYAAKFPGQPLVRNLVLALTDTFYRSVYETFRELAMTHGVWIAVGTNMAPARRVEAADDPDLVALLRDSDEPGRTYAYEAVQPFAPNATYVFAPDGEVIVGDGQGGTLRSPSQTDGVIRGSTSKSYLVPIEQPPPGTGAGLSLSFTPLRDQEVLDTPVGRLAIVISKDAWMVDVNDRFVAKGANVVLQPEAFDSWAFTTSEWSPDVFKEGGYANLQKNPEWVANVDASLTGNLLEITFDGQSAIIGRKEKVDPGLLSPANAGFFAHS
jgi:TetR/AcrR family transcriptional regulator